MTTITPATLGQFQPGRVEGGEIEGLERWRLRRSFETEGNRSLKWMAEFAQAGYDSAGLDVVVPKISPTGDRPRLTRAEQDVIIEGYIIEATRRLAESAAARGGAPAPTPRSAPGAGQSIGDPAEYAKAAYAGLLSAISAVNHFVNEFDRLDAYVEQRAAGYLGPDPEGYRDLIVEQLLADYRIARESVALWEGALRSNFSIDGPISTVDAETGRVAVGSFTATFAGGGLVLHTPDRAPAAKQPGVSHIAIDGPRAGQLPPPGAVLSETA